jgi:hypothetical protein
VLRFDSPEVHFGQLDPYNENRLVRSLTIRFERGRFVERATANEPFRSALEQALTSTPSPPHEHRAPRRAGYLSDLMARARFDGEPVTALVDAEFDLLSHSGGRAGMVILVTSQNQLASAIAARADELHFEPALEVTMTAALLADLLLSWKNLAETIT